jgi:hypothetical protein
LEAVCSRKGSGKEALTKLRPGELVQRDVGFLILGEFSDLKEPGAL